ncbi:MAG: valine--tRNA ligase [Bacteroidetes bacterium]|nr:MAG: valine--tRNA ligase [Bacteroidota bacterium]
MNLSKTYEPKEIENKWYAYWLEKDFFSSKPNPDKEPYTILIPPPNVTGVLHMGHMLNNTIQDILIRKARMEGKEACWIPGTDHASIATEAKVVNMLKEKGIAKKDISRNEFLKYAWEWKEKYGGIILEQLKKLGASCDWKRTRFTMEKALSEQVIQVFVDLYQKGYIYRGARMINWDPQGKTALADDEVNHKEVNSKLYHVRYKIKDSDEWITIATTRPETILGDTAVCVNPNDDRYKHLHGKTAFVPMVNREIPIIADEYVAMDFGTGCLKVTPAHDINDYQLGLKHNLEIIDTINEDGTMSQAAQFYVGLDRFAVRKKIAKDLEEMGQIVKIEDIKNKVGFSERTDAVIEPKISTQWFVSMKELCKPALENILNDNIQLFPPKFKNTYRHWMENVKDWCISRQLWWGQQIPAYFLPNGEFVVAKSLEEAFALAKSKDSSLKIEDLKQEEDVLDTWFSSGLWAMSVFEGINLPDNEDINYYYPTNVLITAPEILFFWVARMILFGYEYRQEKPFKDVYLTGIVRDQQGRKMSKSLGNSPDPLDLIEKYSADGVRVGMLYCSPAGNDLLFDEKLCVQGRNFCNKIWNALRLIKGWEIIDNQQDNANQKAIHWFENKFNQTLIDIEDHYSKYRISDALMCVYKLIWDDFCGLYLEMIKPDYEKPIDRATFEASLNFFERLMQVLHPFMPFITEEIWHLLADRKEKDCIIVSEYPKAKPFDSKILQESELIFELISTLRNTRNAKGISPKTSLDLFIKTQQKSIYENFGAIIRKLANVNFSFTNESVEKSLSFVIKSEEFFVPVQIDSAEEIGKIQKEIEYVEGFLVSVDKKLSNEKFVQNAKPEILANERQKKADAEGKLEALRKMLLELA